MSTDRTREGSTGRHARRGSGSDSSPSGGGGSKKANAEPSMKEAIGTDFMASIVVFLVALPLCIGVAAASGVAPALGIITGIIGGLIVGFLPGSSLQVSGPAAGLAVLVLEFTTKHGVELLGPVVLMSGLIQMVLGVLKAGGLFQSISISVVQGMLAGIGLPLILSQIYALVDSKQLGTPLANVGGLGDLVTAVAGNPQKVAALALGLMAVLLCFVWYKVPAPLNKVPAPLIAVILGCVVGSMPGFDVKKVEFGNMLDAISFTTPAAMTHLLAPDVIIMVITFTVIASAESLFSAAAVDRMHTGPRTQYNKELFAQGVGNAASGLVGAMPLTAVIVRSAANLNAGAKTKLSRILHGAWLLGFGLLLPGLLGLIPIAVLAGVLLHAGWKLFNPPAFVKMWKTDRGEGIVMIITTLAIFFANLLEGVLAGLAVAVVLLALRMSHMSIKETVKGDTGRLELRGNATFLRLPRLIQALEAISDKPRVHVDASKLSHLDLACRSQIEEWGEQRKKAGALHVDIRLPDAKVRPGDVDETEPTGVDGPTPVETTAELPGSGAAENAFAHQAPSASDFTDTLPPTHEHARPYQEVAYQQMGPVHAQAEHHTGSHARPHPQHATQHVHHTHPGQYHPGHTHPGHTTPGYAGNPGQVHHHHHYPAQHPYPTPPYGYPTQQPQQAVGQPQPYPMHDSTGQQPVYDPTAPHDTWGHGDEWASQSYGEGSRR
ncbi:SulP family inorganic anion transporter [Streptomyces sp. NPDC049906]|uniref:SulP family inorganic anion transporter n=1 Tax=Streptomyces sp. NPDC049906 TaxID=3155656 RepID=UPI0034189480